MQHLKTGQKMRHGQQIVTVEFHPSTLSDGTRSDEWVQCCWFDAEWEFHRKRLRLEELEAI